MVKTETVLIILLTTLKYSFFTTVFISYFSVRSFGKTKVDGDVTTVSSFLGFE